MTLILLLILGIPALLLAGHYISWLSDLVWQTTLDVGMWANKKSRKPTVQCVVVDPSPTLDPPNAKKEATPPPLSHEFMEEFGNWMEQAIQNNQERPVDVPRFTKNPNNR